MYNPEKKTDFSMTRLDLGARQFDGMDNRSPRQSIYNRDWNAT